MVVFLAFSFPSFSMDLEERGWSSFTFAGASHWAPDIYFCEEKTISVAGSDQSID